jgi:O-acetyl-ADP-ribose deacetylase (regulator of RNase III)
MTSLIHIEKVANYYKESSANKLYNTATSQQNDNGLRLDICGKIAISSGNVELIEADAIIAPFSVQMRASSSCTSMLLKRAGLEVNAELQLVKEHERCEHSKRFHTTQTIDIGGGNLHVKKIIGVVTPSYSKKYDTALVSALTNCFTNALTRAVESKSRTVALAGMFDSVCHAGYDRVLAMHIGLQACKNFLFKYGHKFDYVLFFALNAEELSIFQHLMPLYFPRNNEEREKSLTSLKEMKLKLGGKGGAFSRERKMRVTAMPGVSTHNEKCDDISKNKCSKKSINGNEYDDMNPIDRLESSYTLTSYSPIHESIRSHNKTPNSTPVIARKQKNLSKLKNIDYTAKIKICRAWRVRSTHSKSGNEYIAYEINVIRRKKPETKIFRRFSECREMFNKILDLAYTLGDDQTLKMLRKAEFPSRTFWVSNFDQTVIDERLNKLPKIFAKLSQGVRSASGRVRREVDEFLSSMTATDHDMMCVLRAQEELQNSIKKVTCKSGSESKIENEVIDNITATKRKFGNVLTNKTSNKGISHIAKPKKRNYSKSANVFADDEEVSLDAIEKQHKQFKQQRKQRNAKNKTYLRKVRIKKSSPGPFDGEGNRFITNEAL